MSIDAVTTLDPASGLLSEATVHLPNEVGLWRTVGYLSNTAAAAGTGYSSAVGAFDLRRRASMIRAAGEAVERFALVRVEGDRDVLAVSTDEDRRIDFVSAGLGRASALAYDFPWYRARNLQTGAESQVPAPVVDYGPQQPGEPWDVFFDPSPNGAASGPTATFAQAAALAEVLERDSFLTAWYKGSPLHQIDTARLKGLPDCRGLTQLLESAKTAGIDPCLAFVPEYGSPLHTAVCIICDGSGPGFGAVGLKTSADPLTALLGALQEGLQIRELFLARTPHASSATLQVTDDDSRAAYWSTPGAVQRLQDWVGSFAESGIPAGKPVPDAAALVRHLASRGVGSHWVDLTHRLPVRIRELGWVSGKVVCPGALQLTMDETKGLSIPDNRRAGWESSGHTTPHPLI
ncbi:YcaO-like family protein [Paenarthrobacter sp. NyZ202]|uniref:YcaO-like family protein n=1 Tax=Paenarthrobacter sp. NyZ202 TaxID=3402689 RepID=UPI003CE89269